MDRHKTWTLSTFRTWTVFVVLCGLLWGKSTVCTATAVKESGLVLTAADEQLLSSLDQFELVYSSFQEDSDFTRHRENNFDEINGAKQLRLEGKSTQIDLDLSLNRDLTRAGVRIRHFTKDGAFEELQKPRCHYQGVVRGMAQSTVSLNTCNGISGTIITKEDRFVIKPLSKHDNQTQHLHVLYQVHPEGPIQDLRDLNSLLNISHIELQEASGSSSNTHHRRARRDVSSEVKYIELAVYCSSSMINRYGGANFAFVRMLDIVNGADVYFRQFNTHLVVTYVELWEDNEDLITISDNLHLTLENFYQHIQDSNFTTTTRFDAAHLALGTNVGSSRPYYSTSKQNSICTEKAVSLTEEFDSDVTSASLAHGLAHNLYIYNDDFYNREGRVCACDGSPNSCVMYQRPVDWKPKPPSGFSDCSLEAFEYHLQRGYYSCLFNVPTPQELISFGTCGNGILEFPETCDCGTPEECAGNLCCDSKTCELTLGSECYQGECCSNCQYLSSDIMCRESTTECDISEMCTGSSGNCPDNIYLQDGTPCLENAGYCLNGRCPTRDAQCQDIWGQGSSSAEDCLALNTFARFPFGYCGYTIGDTLTYLNCDSTSNSNTQRQCGMLHCKDAMLSFFPYGLTPRGNNFGEYCLSIWVADLNIADITNPSDVADGTKCDEGKVCHDFDCVSIESLGYLPCPSGQNGTVCSGKGVCTNNAQCLCVDGWSGVACNETAGVSPNATFPPPTPSIPPPFPTPSPNATSPNATFPPPTPTIPPPFPTPSPNATSPNATFPPPPPSIPPPFPTPSPNATSPNATFPPPPPSIPPPFPTPSPNATSPNATFPPPPPSIPPPFPTPSPNATSPNATFPPPPPSIPPPFPTPSPNATSPTATFPPPPPSIPPPFPTPSPNATSPNATFPPPPPSIPPPFPTPSPNATSPNATFPPPPPSIPPPFPTPSPNATSPNATFPPPPPSIPPPFPTPSPNATSPNATFPPPPPSIPPPFPTPSANATSPNATFPPPPPSIPPPFPTPSPNATSPNATFPPPPPSIPPPFPTPSPNATSPNATFPPPPPSIPPPFPTPSPNATSPNATFPPPPPSIPPPFPTPSPNATSPNATFPPPPPSIPPPFPTPSPNATSPNATFPPPPPSIPPPFPTPSPNATSPNATFPPPPPSIPPPFPTPSPNATSPNATFPPPPPSIPPPFPTPSPNATSPNATFPPPPPSIPPPFPTPQTNTTSPPDSNITVTPVNNGTQQQPTPAPSTQPPATQPPTTQPPTTQPPSTQPPSTQPPSTQPRSTQPPSTQPSATQPPATQPPSTQPPTTQPPSTQPPSTQPPSTQPPSTQPPSTQPRSTQPPSTQPSATQPPATQPPSTQPPTTQPPSTQPPSTQPPSTQPPSTQPPSNQPPSTQQPSTQPPSTQPSSTQPRSTQPPSTQPPSTQPPSTQPPSTQPLSTQPRSTQPPSTQPPSTQPPSTQPPSTQPPSTQPSATQPPATQPPSTQPPTTQSPSTQQSLSPGYIMVNLKVTILDSQNNPLYGTSVRVSIAGGTSKDLIVPEMTNVLDIMRVIPGDGSLGIVVNKIGYTSNAVRWSSGITEDLIVRLLQLQPATVEVLGGNMLIESDFNPFGQKAMIQFDTSLVDGATIDAFYALTSDTKVIPETEANSNGDTVELVVFGALELTINDKESGDMISLDGGIEMLVPLDPGLDVKDGNDVSIWTYNETTAFWEEAGVGKILITEDLLAYWQFTAPHLSWWMAADRLDKSTPKPSGTTVKPILPETGFQMRTQVIVFSTIGALIVLLIFVITCIVGWSCRRKNEKATNGTLPVEATEMELEMHPQTFSNKGLVSDDVAIEVNDNIDTMATMEQPENQTSADIEFSTFKSS